MTVFDAYARYYDLINKDKDYAGEARYVHSLIQHYGSGKTHLLDVGCGTGRHAKLFSEMGLQVVGLDRSEAMISEATLKNPELKFHTGDICSFELGEKFEIVSALFHVVSYLTTADQLQAAFASIRNHLVPGGLFVFDCWHGPAVLHQRPEVRIRRLSNDTTNVVRIAEPTMSIADQTVDVDFQIFIEENEVWEEINEKHSMRYLFRAEIESLLADNGMQLVHSEEWLEGNTPSDDSWSVVYIASLT